MTPTTAPTGAVVLRVKPMKCRKLQHLEKNKTFFQKGLDKREQMRYNIKVRKNVYVPLAQPDRVFGYEPKGRGFESLKARQTKEDDIQRISSSFVSRIFMTQNPANFRLREFAIMCASCLWHSSA